MSSSSLFMRLKDSIARNYGENMGKMLIHTGVIGWVLSSAAQVAAIVINDKIPKEQKMFLIPQEIADAGVNIASFYLITQSFKSLTSKLVSTGKWLPKSVRTFLENSNVAAKVGKKGFNVLKDGNLPVDIEKQYKKFEAGMDFIGTTLGSIISCNIVTPIIRNEIAAKRQKSGIAKMNANTGEQKVENVDKKPVASTGKMYGMNDFQAMAYGKYSHSSGLKI